MNGNHIISLRFFVRVSFVVKSFLFLSKFPAHLSKLLQISYQTFILILSYLDLHSPQLSGQLVLHFDRWPFLSIILLKKANVGHCSYLPRNACRLLAGLRPYGRNQNRGRSSKYLQWRVCPCFCNTPPCRPCRLESPKSLGPGL